MKKLLKALLACILAVGMTACSSEQSTTTGPYTDGTYQTSAIGFNGSVEVETVVENGYITSVSILSHEETEGVGTLAVDQLPSNIVDNNSTEVDSIAGATVTSSAILSAVSKAISDEVTTGEMTDGKYTTYAHGQESYVYVSTMIQDQQIKSVTVLSHDETIGIGDYAVERIPTSIVENQSVNVDAVSGATLTSNAIKTAVSEAIELAGGNVDDFSTKVEKEITTVELPEDIDVVIAGAGTAGLIAANRLLEQGLTVVIFEKEDIPGGAMSTTYSGVLSYGSELKALYTGESEEDVEAQLEYVMAYYEGVVTEGNNIEEGFQFWDQILYTSGDYVDWLHDIGVGFATMNDHIGTTPYLAPGAYQGGVGYAMEYLVNRIELLGGLIVYSTPVVDLIQGDDGSIDGLIATNGVDTYTVEADITLLATGGFGNNEEMIAEYYPQYEGEVFNTTAGSDGDGILLGIEYGAGIDSMGRTLGAFLSTYETKYELAFIHYSTPGIIVNIDGDSIGNIVSGNHSMLGAAKADESNGDTFYYVIDEAARLSTIKSNVDGLSFGVSYEPIFETGQAVYYDSLEEAAEILNLPNLVETVETNNAYALAGEADEFGRTNVPYIDTTEGVYLLRVDPTYYVTTGGLSADEEGHILTSDGEIIEGLYGAGDVLGSLEEKDGLKYSYGFDSAMIFGFIVADNIVAELN